VHKVELRENEIRASRGQRVFVKRLP